jgi:hypothetical protein
MLENTLIHPSTRLSADNFGGKCDKRNKKTKKVTEKEVRKIKENLELPCKGVEYM